MMKNVTTETDTAKTICSKTITVRTIARTVPALSCALLATVLLAPTDASAYVGPGAGLSLLGALWALVAAVATAFLFILAWPVRRFLRRRRNAGGKPEATASSMEAAPSSRLDEQHR
ncbi:MAG: hypothetical protein ACPW61_05840 [Methyloligella sp. ZOD6]